jgi:hypothetical protein
MCSARQLAHVVVLQVRSPVVDQKGVQADRCFGLDMQQNRALQGRNKALVGQMLVRVAGFQRIAFLVRTQIPMKLERDGFLNLTIEDRWFVRC